MAGGSFISAMAVIVILAGAGISDVAGQSCFNAALSLTPCLNYITGSSNGSPGGSPTKQCCDAVGVVLNGGVECFCQVITTSNPLGFINRTLALNVPGLCRIRTEPLNQCEANAGVPFLPTPEASPAPSPVDFLEPSPPVHSPAPRDSSSAVYRPAETPSEAISPTSHPLSRGKESSGSYLTRTDLFLSVVGILAGLISASVLS
ncbi:hypothetical protein SUGI_0682970 [Cryptomeria japonica]|uniref:non-specific lipid transfer protein GPI-anchored 16 n=1 Tax=Cryptomeria japonica TaxID=3369 RepID=UPI002414C569|nr:non-specific lipid transfer protein GPI-anchored 16 [Cryptomeria japonica]GLJ33950.1 hypothetical protein SUGI_0682970 [Cryptomeria japonica]